MAVDVFSEAVLLYRSGRLREAEACLSLMGNVDADALMLRASIQADRGRYLDALRSLEQLEPVAAIRPEVWTLKGSVLKGLDRFDEAIRAYDAVLDLFPGYVPGLTNRAALLLLMGLPNQAEKDLEYALALMPGFADACFHKAGICLQRGNFLDGWALYEERLHTKLCPRFYIEYPPDRRWPGSCADIKGKRLLVYGEQGLGDVIQFSRFIPALMDKGAQLILQVPRPLHRLFAVIWPDLLLVDDRTGYAGVFDWHCSLMSVPYLLELKNPTAGPWMGSCVPVQGKKIASKPRIGLVWSGMSVRDLERYTSTRRSMSLANLEPIFAENASFVCLQPNIRSEDLDLMTRWGVEDISGVLTDFYETARQISTLDLVVSIDTSVIHLAAGMGVPAWVILPKVTDYRWSGLPEGSAWYPDVRIFRQKEAGNWVAPVVEVAQAMRAIWG